MPHCRHTWTVQLYSPGGANVLTRTLTLTPSNACFLGPPECTSGPNGISIGSAVFAGLTSHGCDRQTDRLTDTQTTLLGL